MPALPTGLPSLPTALVQRVLQRVLVHAVVAERREAQEHLDALGVGVVDQVTYEVVTDVLVLLIVPPGDRVLLRSKRPADPQQQSVAAVVVDAVHDPLPVSQVVGRHPHEGDVVAPLGERAPIPSRSRGGRRQEHQGDQGRSHHDHDLLGLRAARTISSRMTPSPTPAA